MQGQQEKTLRLSTTTRFQSEATLCPSATTLGQRREVRGQLEVTRDE
jgi:hypothetical protein